MCTVSFVPKPGGFYLTMNRDEKLARLPALPPTIVNLDGRRAVFPREPTGGTWISANDVGLCLALINWHRVEREPVHDTVSRGQVVTELAGESSSKEITQALAALSLSRMRPFRLIAIIPSEETVMEWRWNLERLSTREYAWKVHHWFSSGLDEPKAERERDRVCKAARKQESAGQLDWLRHLHRSHSPERGPFSVCMHRRDATTVSYTEVTVSGRRAIMRYKNGPCCSNRKMVVKTISLARGL